MRDFLPALLFSCLATLLTVNACAASEAELRQVERVQQLYRGLTSLSFDFRQSTRSGGRDRRGAGSAVFYRPAAGSPGVMRWNYTEPDVQILVNDGSKLSIYTQKDKQVLVSSAAELESDITYAFFAGGRNLSDDFAVQPADSRFVSSAGLQAAQLIPKKPHGQIKAVHCWFDSSFTIRKLVMEDHFDTQTELVFSNVKFNALPAGSAKTAEELVRLELPPGTEVLTP